MIEKKTIVRCDSCMREVDTRLDNLAGWVGLEITAVLSPDDAKNTQAIHITSPTLIFPPRAGEVYTQEFCCLACARAWFGGAKRKP